MDSNIRQRFRAGRSRNSELRRVYLRLPWPHLYEYADSTVVVVHERRIMGDLGLLPLRFQKPDAVPIGELSELIRRAAATPLEGSGFHRKLVAIARLPLLVRRLIFLLCLNLPRLRRGDRDLRRVVGRAVAD